MPIISNFPGGSAKKTLLQVIKDKIIPSKSEKTFNVEDGYDGFGNFIVGAIPDEYQDVTGVTATAEGTLAGTSFVNAYGEVVDGAMPNNDDVSATFDGIDKKSVDILPGYTTGGTIALTDDIDNEVSTQADFLAQIIEELEGKTAGGGGIDTSDANVTPADMREGTRAYAQGAPVDGAIPTRSDADVTVGNTSVVIPAGIYDDDINLAIESAGGGTPRIISSDAVQVTNASATSSMTFTFNKPSETAILKGVYVVFSGATSISTGTITSVTYLRDFYKGTNETTEETNLTYTYLSGMYGAGSNVNTYMTATVTDNTNSVVVKFTNTNSHKFAATFSYKAYPIFIDGGTAEETVMETWEFTLEDGSTVEKEIEVGA